MLYVDKVTFAQIANWLGLLYICGYGVATMTIFYKFYKFFNLLKLTLANLLQSFPRWGWGIFLAADAAKKMFNLGAEILPGSIWKLNYTLFLMLAFSLVEEVTPPALERYQSDFAVLFNPLEPEIKLLQVEKLMSLHGLECLGLSCFCAYMGLVTVLVCYKFLTLFGSLKLSTILEDPFYE
jgi:hypothetical protein